MPLFFAQGLKSEVIVHSPIRQPAKGTKIFTLFEKLACDQIEEDLTGHKPRQAIYAFLPN